MKPTFGIVIHGGAGTILKNNLTPELEQAYREKLQESLMTGYKILEDGGSALDATQAAVVVMEDSELFNAGKGAVFTHDGINEMDAAIMCGRTNACGGITNVRHVKNPILLARAVMDKSEHVLLGGDGAEEFAKVNNIELVDKKYFHTERRWNQLQNAIEKEKKSENEIAILDHDGDSGKHGTVGAVALDKDGNLAAATSTGGMTNKRFGRIGDTPCIGNGNFANNVCAVSTTGHGEFFMRLATAHDVSALMEYKNITLEQAGDEAIQKLSSINGTGGLIAIDKECNVIMPMNTPGMYRACLIEGQPEPIVKIYADE